MAKPFVQGFLGHFHHPLHGRVASADSHGCGVIADIAIVAHPNVETDDVSELNAPPGGQAVHNLFVDGDANPAGIIPIAKEGTFATVAVDALPGVLVNLQCADTRLDKGGNLPQHGGGNPTGQAHGLNLMIFFQVDHVISGCPST